MRKRWLDRFIQAKNTPEQRQLRRGADRCIDMACLNRMALGVCFSEERDLLSQWRGYAEDGRGYAITFHRERLEEVAKENSSNGLELTKIAYGGKDIDEINSIARTLGETFMADAERYEAANGVGYISVDWDAARIPYEKAARSLFTVKNGAFHEEKEWRLFTYGTLSSFEGVKLRGTGNALSPYLPVAIPTDSVARVTLGPVNKTPEHVLEFALESNGFNDVYVSQSRASYQTR